MRRGLVLVIAIAALLPACGGDDSAPGGAGAGGSSGCAEAAIRVDGACISPGIQESGCPAGQLVVEGGGCRPAGLPPELCTPTDEGRGCAPILPADACPDGQMAVPGETACHEIAPCGSGPWGDIPVDATTELVDASFTGTSDGSESKPWAAIQDAIDAAAPGAIVAVAAGTYAENVVIGGRAVKLRGRCPSMVEIVGDTGKIGAVFIKGGAGGSEVSGLALRGGDAGLVVSGSQEIVADRLWIHDTGKNAMTVQDTFGATGISITGSLIEAGTESGIFVAGAVAKIEASVIRETRPRTDDLFGRGISVRDDHETGTRASATVVASVVERNHDVGIFIEGSDATIDTTVVQDTEPGPDGTFGQGINIRDEETNGERSVVTIVSSVVARNHATGVFVSASDATLEGVLITGTQPELATATFGFGMEIKDAGPGARASVTLRSSVIDGSHVLGLLLNGADATIDGSVIAATQPEASDQLFGMGIQVQLHKDTGERGALTVRSSLIDANHEAGILCAAAEASVETSIVRGTEPRASDGAYGDGIAVASAVGQANAVVTTSRIEHSSRAGVSAFGGGVQVGNVVLECNTFHLDGEIVGGSSPAFEDLGGNVCGCDGASVSCTLLSSNLEPPEALP